MTAEASKSSTPRTSQPSAEPGFADLLWRAVLSIALALALFPLLPIALAIAAVLRILRPPAWLCAAVLLALLSAAAARTGGDLGALAVAPLGYAALQGSALAALLTGIAPPDRAAFGAAYALAAAPFALTGGLLLGLLLAGDAAARRGRISLSAHPVLSAPPKGEGQTRNSGRGWLAALLGLGGAALPWRPAAKLARVRAKEGPWYVHGYLRGGAVTVLAAAPKAGKSTLAMAMLHATHAGASFLGLATARARVLYATEETPAVFAQKVRTFGLERAPLHTMHWPEMPAERLDWETLAPQLAQECRRRHAQVLVIDPLAQWAPGVERSEAGIVAAIGPLKRLAARGIAVLLIHHARKDGGSHGASLRGSSALAGICDVIVELQRVDDAPQERRLLATSRFVETPEEIRCRLDDGTRYVRSGPAEAKASRSGALKEPPAKAAIAPGEASILALLATHGADLTMAEIRERLGVPQTVLFRRLRRLLGSGALAREGAGTSGEPYRYRIADMEHRV